MLVEVTGRWKFRVWLGDGAIDWVISGPTFWGDSGGGAIGVVGDVVAATRGWQ